MDTSLNLDRDGLRRNRGKILALIITFAIALVMTLYGWTAQCFGMFIVGAMLYMVPHMAGVDNKKLLGVYGIAFLAVALSIGVGAVAPGVGADNEEPPIDGRFTDIQYGYADGTVELTAIYNGALREDAAIVLLTNDISGIGFSVNQIYGTNPIEHMFDDIGYDPVTGLTVAEGAFELDPDTLHLGQICVKDADGGYAEKTNSWFLTDAFEGDMLPLCLTGTFMTLAYVMIIFFTILIFSSLMRSRLVKAREQMEKEGRLYPVGYGRCDNCHAIVLPGEVNCRKCGAYIDRPDEMKPDKKEMYTCSECGAEVTADALTCPKCGSDFEEGIETEYVAPAPEPVRIGIVSCPECGTPLPSDSEFCPRCGKDLG